MFFPDIIIFFVQMILGLSYKSLHMIYFSVDYICILRYNTSLQKQFRFINIFKRALWNNYTPDFDGAFDNIMTA